MSVMSFGCPAPQQSNQSQHGDESDDVVAPIERSLNMARHRVRRLGTAVALTVGASVVAAAAPSDVSALRSAKASVTLHDAHGAVVGWAKLHEDGRGRVHVNVHVTGLTAGAHGIHVHAVGSCIAPFASAGPHHNPTGAKHGEHAGDLPNLVVGANGKGHLNTKTARFTLTGGPTTVFDGNGSALVIHAAADDHVTDPAGNSGARIACGVVTAR
jgi:Cu-Zn family superoxide dismutase